MRAYAGGVKTTFVNELGNTVTIEVEAVETDRNCEQVVVRMSGPHVAVENIITRNEAECLLGLLEQALKNER
jgi:hypothetical protein